MTVENLTQYFTEAEQSTIESREESERHRDYYDGYQWTDTEIEEIESRGQPVITDNKIKDKVDTLLGREVASRTDPKAYPRTPADEGVAAAATDSLRYVADNNNLDKVKSNVGNCMFVEGTGGSSVTINKRGEVKIIDIMWDRLFYDPHSRRKDFADAKYLGEAIWMDADDAARKYPEAAIDFQSAMAEAHNEYGETYADKPLSKWVDPKRKRVRIVEIYHIQDGVWHRALIGKDVELETNAPSPYLDEYDEPEHPYVFQSAYVDRNGRRYGVIRRYQDLQDEHNKRRSKLLHLASAKTIKAEAGAVDNIKTAKQELKKPDGWITVNRGKELDVISNDVEMKVQTNLLLHTDQQLSETAPNSAIQGLSGRVSGRAKQIDQQAGELPITPLYDGLRDWQLRTYRKSWNRIRQFWTEEKWIRVRDDNDLRFVPLNKPMTKGDAFERAQAEGLNPPQPINPNEPLLTDTGEPVLMNDIGRMDMDIIMEQSPDYPNLQAETFETLINAMRSGVFQVPASVVLEMAPLSPKVKARIANEIAKQSQGIAEFEERLKVLELMLKEADVIKKRSEAKENEAQALEAKASAQLKEVEAVNVALGEEKAG